MKLYICADMEGTAAVCSWTQVDPTNTTEYPYYRRLMSQEVRAAIDGARAAGVRDVLVNDSHSAMRNVLWDELPDDVRMIYGNRKPFSMAEGADGSFDAAFFTGYHAGIGTQDGVLDHTYTDETLRETRVNGRVCNEAMLNAAVLGLAGVPVVLVTGDRVAVEQMRSFLPWATGVVVKDSIGRYATNSLSPARARELIRAGAHAAIGRIGEAAAVHVRAADRAGARLRLHPQRRLRRADPRLRAHRRPQRALRPRRLPGDLQSLRGRLPAGRGRQRPRLMVGVCSVASDARCGASAPPAPCGRGCRARRAW